MNFCEFCFKYISLSLGRLPRFFILLSNVSFFIPAICYSSLKPSLTLLENRTCLSATFRSIRFILTANAPNPIAFFNHLVTDGPSAFDDLISVLTILPIFVALRYTARTLEFLFFELLIADSPVFLRLTNIERLSAFAYS